MAPAKSDQNQIDMAPANSKQFEDIFKVFLLELLDLHSGPITCMALSEDSSILATGSMDMTARMWMTMRPNSKCMGLLKGHTDRVTCIVIDDNHVITGSADRSVRRWDMSTCDCVQTFVGHSALVNRVISTGDFVFSSSTDCSARCWDVDTGECVREFTGHQKGVDPLIYVPIEDNEESEQIFTWEGNKDVVVTGSEDSTVRVWSFETGKCVYTLSGHNGPVNCMTMDANGKVLFTGSADRTIRMWNVLSGQHITAFEGHESDIVCLTIVDNVLHSGTDNNSKFWITEHGPMARAPESCQQTLKCMKIYKGFVFTGCGDCHARCFDAKAGVLKKDFQGHRGAVTCLEVLENKLFTGSADSTIRVWDISDLLAEEAQRSQETNSSDV